MKKTLIGEKSSWVRVIRIECSGSQALNVSDPISGKTASWLQKLQYTVNWYRKNVQFWQKWFPEESIQRFFLNINTKFWPILLQKKKKKKKRINPRFRQLKWGSRKGVVYSLQIQGSGLLYFYGYSSFSNTNNIYPPKNTHKIRKNVDVSKYLDIENPYVILSSLSHAPLTHFTLLLL